MKGNVKRLLCLILTLAMGFPTGITLSFAADEAKTQQTDSVLYENKDYIVRFSAPAEDSIEGWKNESLPIGNGYMGVNIFGGVEYDRLQVTEQSMFTSGSSYVNNRYSAGQESFADVYIDTDHTLDAAENYSRTLRLNDGVASVSYTYDGVDYTREYFSSYPDKVSVMKLTASGEGNLNFTLRPTISYERDSFPEANNLDESGKRGTVVADGDTITMEGHSEYYSIDFEAQFKVVADGGEVTAENGTDDDGNTDNGTITVSGANSAYIYFAVGTNYELTSSTFTASRADKVSANAHPHDKVTGYMTDASVYSYDELKARHRADVLSYFNRNVFDIGGVDDGRTTSELITSYKAGTQEKYLEELYYQMGRYMMIASSREGTLPPGLQGIWNAYLIAPWTAGFWYNVNQQMNYWPIFTTNLGDLYKAYSDFNLARLPAAETNGSTYIKKYRADQYEEGNNGWIIGTGNSAYTVAGVSAGGHSGPGTGGFTAISDIDYFRFTNDTETLSAVYPIIESLARFYSKCVDNYDGLYLATISASPENKHNGAVYPAIGCAFDQQMIYETNKAVIDIYDEYKDILENPDTELIEKLRAQVDYYDQVIIGLSGQVKEYREEDYYGDIGEYTHRHISQLVGLYPGTSINDETPAWVDGAKVTLRERGLDTGTGWSVAHKLGLWARTGDGETSHGLVQGLIGKHLFDNLWNCHDTRTASNLSTCVFQAEGNFGGTAGIAEMLMQSHGEYIKVLPALPSAWADGSFKGMVARGNFDVSADWANGIANKIEVTSNAGEAIKLNYYNIAEATVTDESGNAVSFEKVDKDHIIISSASKVVITDIPSYAVTADVSDVSASKDGNDAIVTWTASSDEAAAYNVYRALESEPTYELMTTTTETSYTDTTREGRQATYKITAVSEGSEESLGGTSTVIPTAGAVTEITAFMADDTNLQLQWEIPENAYSFKIYEKTADGYTLLLETEDTICIIENASADKVYAISAVFYDTESEMTDITIGEIGENVSKLELYNYIAEVKALYNEGFTDEDLATIEADIEAVEAVWYDTEATAEDVAEAVLLAKEILDTSSYFSKNVVLGKTAILKNGITVNSGYPVSNMTDGDTNTRMATNGGAKSKLYFEIDLEDAYSISEFTLIDFRDGNGSRGDNVTVEGLLSNGKWITMATAGDEIIDYTYSGGKRTIDMTSNISLPVSEIRVTMTDTDSVQKDMSIWEFKAIGAKNDSRPVISNLAFNPDKPTTGSITMVENTDNGKYFYSDRNTFFNAHMGSGFKGLTQILLPVDDSTRAKNDTLNTFLQGDNTYFSFSANSDGKIYVAFTKELPNFTEERGWKKVSGSAPALPDGVTDIKALDWQYEFESAPYYVTKIQTDGAGTISYADRRGWVYEKTFSAYENVEVPTIGISTNENYFVAVDLNGENTNSELDYIFYGDQMVKAESGKYDYEFEVESETETVDLSALAKSSAATVEISSETLTFTNGLATATVKVISGENVSKYTLTFKKLTNVALNKAISVDPTSLAQAGSYGSFSNEAIVDGSFDGATGRYYSGEKKKVVAEIDLGAVYDIEYMNVSEFLGKAPMRTDNLTIEAYRDGAWNTVLTGEALDGDLSGSTQYSTTRFDFSERFRAEKIRLTFKNTAYEIGDVDSDGDGAYDTTGTSVKDISIVEVEAYGVYAGSHVSESECVEVYPVSNTYDKAVLSDDNSETYYEAEVDFVSESAYAIFDTSAYTDIETILVTPKAYADGEEYYFDRPVGYKVYTSEDNITFTQVKSGEIAYDDFNDFDTKTIALDSVVNAKYIKLEITSVYGARADEKTYFSLAEVVFGEKGEETIEPIDGMQFYNIRDGFSNSYIKFNEKETATVAFLGGSITAASGYRVNLMNYLKEKFPDTQFTFVNAGIPSTDSTMGAFRLDKDILSKGDVDLLFVEFAVNDEDNARSETESIKGMEGIIRHAYEANPYMDIMVMHFSDPAKHSQYSATEEHTMPVIDAQEKAVSHYNVISLDLAKEVSAKIANGELTWEEFGGKHPSAAGHKIYSDGMIAVLEKSWTNAASEKSEKILPEKLNENSYTNGRYEDISGAVLTNGFTYVESWAPTDGVSTRDGFVNVPMLESTTTDASLTYTFVGTDLGILLPAGPDVGYITYSIDGGEEKTQNLFTNWSKSLHIPWVYMLATELDYGEHTITISASETKDSRSTGNAVRIQSFLVNGEVLEVTSPIERDLHQRNDENQATFTVSGNTVADSVEILAVRMAGYSAGADMAAVTASVTDGKFEKDITLYGGYYKVTVKAIKDGEVIATEEIDRVGVGEIFITAGQSNSASFSQDETSASDDRVSSYDYANGKWVFAKDPQVSLGDANEFTSWGNKDGETRSGGSVWPTLGDILTKELDVPVGFINIGIGSSQVSSWNGSLYSRMQRAVTAFGKNGVRAVLWHQGENDSKAGTTTESYKADLTEVIEKSRADAGWDIPWVISIAAYHNNEAATEENQEMIRTAQRAVIAEVEGAYKGPYTDDMSGELRDATKVHFSLAGLKEFASRWWVSLENAFFMSEYPVSVSSGESITAYINGGDAQVWGEIKTASYRMGTEFKLVASDNGTNKFMYWQDVLSGKIVSYSKEYSFVLGSVKDIRAVYADSTKEALITFKGMGDVVYTIGYNSVTVPSNPYLMGYEFSGWYDESSKIKLDIKAEEDFTSEANISIKAAWKTTDVMYNVTVTGANEQSAQYKYNSKVSLTAKETDEEGNAFSYWMRDGNIVSYSAEYSFYVSGDTEVEAVYGAGNKADVVIVMANPVLVGTDKIAFFAERLIPDDFSVVETGILMGDSADLSIENHTYKAIAKSTSNKGQYTVRKKGVASGETWYGAAYVIYRDADGTLYTAYSNEVSYTLK